MGHEYISKDFDLVIRVEPVRIVAISWISILKATEGLGLISKDWNRENVLFNMTLKQLN